MPRQNATRPCEKASLSIGAQKRGWNDDEDESATLHDSSLFRGWMEQTERETEEKNRNRANRRTERAQGFRILYVMAKQTFEFPFGHACETEKTSLVMGRGKNDAIYPWIE